MIEPLLSASDRPGGLLARGLAVQVVVGEGLHGADPVPYQSHHLLLGDGEVQVDPLQGHRGRGEEERRGGEERRRGFTYFPLTDFWLQKSTCCYLSNARCNTGAFWEIKLLR